MNRLDISATSLRSATVRTALEATAEDRDSVTPDEMRAAAAELRKEDFSILAQSLEELAGKLRGPCSVPAILGLLSLLPQEPVTQAEAQAQEVRDAFQKPLAVPGPQVVGGMVDMPNGRRMPMYGGITAPVEDAHGESRWAQATQELPVGDEPVGGYELDVESK
jgi:hypothetical protein